MISKVLLHSGNRCSGRWLNDDPSLDGPTQGMDDLLLGDLQDGPAALPDGLEYLRATDRMRNGDPLCYSFSANPISIPSSLASPFPGLPLNSSISSLHILPPPLLCISSAHCVMEFIEERTALLGLNTNDPREMVYHIRLEELPEADERAQDESAISHRKHHNIRPRPSKLLTHLEGECLGPMKEVGVPAVACVVGIPGIIPGSSEGSIRGSIKESIESGSSRGGPSSGYAMKGPAGHLDLVSFLRGNILFSNNDFIGISGYSRIPWSECSNP